MHVSMHRMHLNSREILSSIMPSDVIKTYQKTFLLVCWHIDPNRTTDEALPRNLRTHRLPRKMVSPLKTTQDEALPRNLRTHQLPRKMVSVSAVKEGKRIHPVTFFEIRHSSCVRIMRESRDHDGSASRQAWRVNVSSLRNDPNKIFRAGHERTKEWSQVQGET